jgi:hypothetical protein
MAVHTLQWENHSERPCIQGQGYSQLPGQGCLLLCSIVIIEERRVERDDCL